MNTPMATRFKLDPYTEDIKQTNTKGMKLFLAARKDHNGNKK